MSISDYSEAAILNLIFRAQAFTNFASSTGITNIPFALHSADPGEAGNQTTSEMSYTGPYARINVARTTAGWGAPTGTPTAVSPAANITFAASSSAGATATYFSTGDASTGSSNILWSGTVTPSIACTSGVTPILTTASTISLDNFAWLAVPVGLLLLSLKDALI